MMNNGRQTTISGKLVQKLGMVLSVSTVVLLIFVSSYTFISAGQIARNEARVIAESKARFVESELSHVMVEVASIAEGFAAGKGDDQLSWSYASRILKSNLESSPSSYSAYGYWIAGEFRGANGEDSIRARERTSPFITEIWWKKDSAGTIALGAVEDLSSPDVYKGNPWWDIPIDSNVQALIDPYYDQYARLLMISAVAPIKRDSKSIGLVGIDVAISELQLMADTTKVFGGKGKLMILAADQSLCALSGGLEPVQAVEGTDTVSVMPKLSDLYPVDMEHISKILAEKKTTSEWWGNNLAVIVPVQVKGNAAVWASVVIVPWTTVFAHAAASTILLVIVMIFSGVATSAIVASAAKKITQPLVHVSAVCRKIAAGETDADLTADELGRTDEIGELSRGFQQVIESWRSKIESARDISSGNLQTNIALASENDQLGIALTQMRNSLAELVLGIAESSRDVFTETAAISSMGIALTDEASRSAAAVEEMSAALREIRSTMQDETVRIGAIEKIANVATVQARGCLNEMAELSSAMTDVSRSSEQMAKIIKTIDSIAFQTNLLALNAAVEAARAGVHGKGFAVVADEVRTLASRSAKAASETQMIIDQDRKLVLHGYQLTEKVAAVLNSIVEQIKTVDELVAGSAEDSKNQLIAIDEITTGLTQIEKATTTTAMTADQTHESLNKLENESATLNELVSHFSVDLHDDRSKLLNNSIHNG